MSTTAGDLGASRLRRTTAGQHEQSVIERGTPGLGAS